MKKTMDKIAICSTTGEKVDMHFGKTTGFMVFNIGPDKYKKLVEVRSISEYCQPGQVHGPDLLKLEAIYQLLNDCKSLYTAKIGDKPREFLTNMGLNIRECKCSVELLPDCKCN